MRISLKARLLCQTAGFALLLPGLALAQSTDTLLSPIVVEGESGTGPVGGIANPATQAGAKTATPVTEIPQSVSVVGSEELQAANISKLDEALGYVSGVQGAPFGYDSDTNWYFVRGFQATANGVFQDALAHFSFGFGGFYIDPYTIERIEVLKGPASVLYGGSNPGGIINYVSKMPTERNEGQYELGFDEDGRVWLGADVNRVISDRVAYRFAGKVERVDGNGAFEPGFHGVIAPSVKLNFGATDVTLLASYTRVDEDHVGGAWLPYVGTVVPADFGYVDRDFNTGEPGLDWYERDQFTLTSIIEHNFGNGWTLSNTSRLGWSDIDEQSVYGSNPAYRFNFGQTTETNTFLNDSRLEKTFANGGVEQTVMVGVDLKYFDLNEQQFFSSVGPISLTNPVYGTVTDLPPLVTDTGFTQKQAGVYVQDQIRWGDGWIATLNARYDWAQTENKGVSYGAPVNLDTTDEEATYRIGLAKEIGNGFFPYASVATFFNPPTSGSRSDGKPVEAEHGEQYEVGFKWAPTGRNLLITAAAFDLTRENVQQTGPTSLIDQLGKVRSRGIEIEGKGEIMPGLMLKAAITSMDVEQTESSTPALLGKTPYITVEKFASLGLAYDVPSVEGLTVSGGVRYIGSSWVDNLNTQEVPSVTLLDAGASYEFGDGWQANFAVSNLTDETYVASCQGAEYCFYGDGRKASLAIRKSF